MRLKTTPLKMGKAASRECVTLIQTRPQSHEPKLKPSWPPRKEVTMSSYPKHIECPGSAQSPKEAQEVGSTCLANREAWLGMGNVNRKEMGTHFITRLAESKAVAGAAHGRPVGNRHRLQLMSCVTFMVNQPVGSMSTCIPFTLAKSCLLMVPLQAISHSLWHLECSQSSPAGDC